MGRAQRQVIDQFGTWIEDGVRIAFISQIGGCGMSTLLKHVSEIRGFGDLATQFLMTTATTTRPLDALADAIGLPAGNRSEGQVATALEASARDGIHTIWLVDSSAGMGVPETRALSTQLPLLTVILASGFDSVAGDDHVCLQPLRLDETREFVKQSLHMAGCVSTPFTDEDMVAIHRSSGGRIKRICQVAERALREAAPRQSQAA